ETNVVFAAATLVSMAFKTDLHVGVLDEVARMRVQRLEMRGRNVAAVELEVDNALTQRAFRILQRICVHGLGLPDATRADAFTLACLRARAVPAGISGFGGGTARGDEECREQGQDSQCVHENVLQKMNPVSAGSPGWNG